MATFVLIIAIKLGYGVAVTSITGYQADQCRAAVVSLMTHQQDGVVSGFCIPGPTTK